MVILLIFFVYLADFTHLLVEVEQVAFGIVERHGNQVGVEHLFVFAGNGLDAATLVRLVSDVLCGIDDVEGLPIFLFHNGIAIKDSPKRLLKRALVEAEIHFEMADDTRRQLLVEDMNLFCFFR